jgi:hypothetical protein
MLSQSDIDYLIETLDSAIKSEDWELVEEARDYLLEFQDTPIDEDEDE